MAWFPSPFVSVEWLAEHLDEVAVADVRWYLDGRSGRAAYAVGHVPGAVFIDLDADLSREAGGTHGRHPLPAPEQFALAMARAGIGDDTPVVAYDDSGGGSAARLVWMLRVTGHDAALLDGGVRAWTGPVETGMPASSRTASFTAIDWPASALVDADEVATLAATDGAVVLDARSPDRYAGESEPVDARAGHIPGARSAPWNANLDSAGGRYQSPDDLRQRFEGFGVEPGATVVAYCGSGVSACANLLALEAAGFPDARLFVPSWSGWSADPERPVATGPEP